jgi:hypothetical protein
VIYACGDCVNLYAFDAGASGVPLLSFQSVRLIEERSIARGPTNTGPNCDTDAGGEGERNADMLRSLTEVGGSSQSVGADASGPSYLGSAILRDGHDSPDLREVRIDGDGKQEGGGDLCFESAMLPYMFPKGTGMYPGGKMTLPDYLRRRAKMLFSPFTLVKPYVFMMHQLRQVRVFLVAMAVHGNANWF